MGRAGHEYEASWVAWVRLHDGALSHPKIVGIFDPRRPFDLWMWGLSYCQAHLTDGVLPKDAIPRGCSKAITSLVRRGLWHEENSSYRVHDFLHWNDTREVVRNRQRLAKHRQAFLSDPGLRRALRHRDQDRCRYCNVSVNWNDRRGVLGATYDHVDPHGDATLGNLVVACRGCNSRKSNRTPQEAGMTLLSEPGLDLGPDLGSVIQEVSGNQTEPNQTK